MTKQIPKRSHDRIRNLHDEGFSIDELAVMYETSSFQVMRVLENENT